MEETEKLDELLNETMETTTMIISDITARMMVTGSIC